MRLVKVCSCCDFGELNGFGKSEGEFVVFEGFGEVTCWWRIDTREANFADSSVMGFEEQDFVCD